jgi:hypothetical protein
MAVLKQRAIGNAVRIADFAAAVALIAPTEAIAVAAVENINPFIWAQSAQAAERGCTRMCDCPTCTDDSWANINSTFKTFSTTASFETDHGKWVLDNAQRVVDGAIAGVKINHYHN